LRQYSGPLVCWIVALTACRSSVLFFPGETSSPRRFLFCSAIFIAIRSSRFLHCRRILAEIEAPLDSLRRNALPVTSGTTSNVALGAQLVLISQIRSEEHTSELQSRF